ncbi:hypothetical protein, partial [Salmonella sp. s60131]|uniref:hypothetical protein n=1 Tax=Salmonella sp. s60131 TaxID=3159722 RepID=UPI003980BE30
TLRIKAQLKVVGETTGLCVNWQKSEIMLFNQDNRDMEEISNHELKVCKCIKYPVILLDKDISKTKERNYTKIKEEIRNKLQNYSKLNLSWFGRIAMVKMKILPKIRR